jgi:ATP-binding cassette subfamily F protein 3
LEVEGGHVHIYPGNYEDYLYRKQSEAATASAPGVEQQQAAPKDAAPTESVESSARAKRLNPIKLKQMQERNEFVEEEIPRLESAIAHTETELGRYVSAEETQRQTVLLQQLREQHASLLAEWEELALQLEEQASLS